MDQKFTLIFSPHIDDVFFSLYSTIISGKLGKNIIGVNMFSMTNSEIKMAKKDRYSFGNIRKVVFTRMKEELMFSEHLYKKFSINYIPLFPGLIDTRLDMFCIPKDYMAKYLKYKSKSPRETSQLIQIFATVFKDMIKEILFPIGLKHRAHVMLTDSFFQLEKPLTKKFRIGLYADIPYSETVDSIAKLKTQVPITFSHVNSTDFNSKSKLNLLKQIYKSQYTPKMASRFKKIENSFGEVIFWNRSS